MSHLITLSTTYSTRYNNVVTKMMEEFFDNTFNE